MATVIQITNLTTGEIYKFFTAEVGNLNYSLQNKLLKLEIPEDPSLNVSANLGVERIWNFPFKLVDTTDSTESADPTDTIYTPGQKQAYLRGTFISNGIEDFYELTFTTNHGTISSIKCMLEGFTLDFNSQNPMTLTGNFSFSQGGGLQ